MRVKQPPSTLDAFHISLVGLTVLAYCVILHIAYQFQISPLNVARGLTYRSPDLARYSLAIFLVAVIAWSLPRQCRRASDYMQWLPFIVAGAPSILLPQYMQALDEAEATHLGLAVAGSLLLCRALTFGTLSVTKMQPAPVGKLWAILAVLAVTFYLYVAAVAGIPHRWVDLSEVYGVRSSFAATVGGTLVPRLLPSFYNVINPILMARGLFAKRPTLFMIGAGGQVLIYLWEAQKSVLLSIPLTVGLFLLLRQRKTIYGYSFLVGTILLSTVSLTLARLQVMPELADLFVRRLMVIPGAVTVAYVSVFSDRDKSFFSELWLGGANPSSLAREPALAVGRLFFGDSTTHANVNIWGHGYLNFGYAGMFVMAILYALVLRMLDVSSEGLPAAVVAVVFAPMALVIASADLFTALVTHGLWAMLLICLFLPRTGWSPGAQQTNVRAPIGEFMR